MSNCQSTYQVIGELWEKYGEVAKKLGCAVAGAITTNPELIPECIRAADKIEDVCEDMISAWNSLVGTASFATLGPRMLNPGTEYAGTIIGPTERTFITHIPCHFDRGRVRLSEKDGKAKTEINIWLTDPNGHCTEVGNYLLNEDNTEQKDVFQTIDRTFSGAMGKFVIVHLDGKSVTNKFKYTVRLTEA